jgi:3-hydroxybutyryl-CoA dehydrogenase
VKELAVGEIERVGVVGAGQMGLGIAEVCARRGMDVVLTDNAPGAQEAGRRRIEASLDRGVRSGKVTDAEREATLARLTFTSDLGDFADRQLVVEAVAENESVKLDVFAALDKVVAAPDAILASNTSSIPIMKLAMATGRPAQVVGIHFFNPVPVLHLVELIPSLLTGEDTAARAEEWATALGKSVVRAQDRAGFVVNALLIPYLLSAIRMFESGFASAQDIDNGMVLGCAHPMGPLRLTDLIGLATTMASAESMHAEFKEALYSPPPLLRRMVEAGLLGKKTGRGFYEYAK